MKVSFVFPVACVLIVFLAAGCANIVPPSGGQKDTVPPKLLSVMPKDSLLNTKLKKLELHFDEYITVADAFKEVQISPLLPSPLSVTTNLKKLIITIPDTLLLDNTTYKISFGNAIRDVHEGNVFSGYHYLFSTGNYFDSLQITGNIINAATGLPDSGAIIMLYDSKVSDSAIVKQKPLYVGNADNAGYFKIEGLPARTFKIFALKDRNGNLIFDGGAEQIAFSDSLVRPHADSGENITLRIFQEENDTAKNIKPGFSRADVSNTAAVSYQVQADTADVRKRTVEITKPLQIIFNKPLLSIFADKIFLSYDSLGSTMEANTKITFDSTKNNISLLVQTNWRQNTVYTLRLLKGFVKDSTGVDAMPSKTIFRTKREEDYAKLHIHLPAKYRSKKFVLEVTKDRDTVYQKTVTDTLVHLFYLTPGDYFLKIIGDENENGKWDTGNVLEKKQPEYAYPYDEPTQLKAGWENITDFDESKKNKPLGKK